jgi:hypothetical protein
MKAFIAVVKKTFRYSNGFFYNRLYRNSMFRNFIMESGILLAAGIIALIACQTVRAKNDKPVARVPGPDGFGEFTFKSGGTGILTGDNHEGADTRR